MPLSSWLWLAASFFPFIHKWCFIRRYPCSAPCPSDDLTGWILIQAAYFDCAGIRVLKYILKLSNDSKLIVKEPFGYSVNLYRCLVQTLLAYWLSRRKTQDRTIGSFVKASLTFWTDTFYALFPIYRRSFFLTTEGHIDVGLGHRCLVRNIQGIRHRHGCAQAAWSTNEVGRLL